MKENSIGVRLHPGWECSLHYSKSFLPSFQLGHFAHEENTPGCDRIVSAVNR